MLEDCIIELGQHMTIVHLELEPWHVEEMAVEKVWQSQLSQRTDTWYIHGTCGIAVLRRHSKRLLK